MGEALSIVRGGLAYGRSPTHCGWWVGLWGKPRPLWMVPFPGQKMLNWGEWRKGAKRWHAHINSLSSALDCRWDVTSCIKFLPSWHSHSDGQWPKIVSPINPPPLCCSCQDIMSQQQERKLGQPLSTTSLERSLSSDFLCPTCVCPAICGFFQP